MKKNLVLWIVQVVLAALFVFAGGLKLVLPIEAIAQGIGLPGTFLRFIGLAELAGGFGLVLPGLTGIRRDLTPIAACGLTIIMSGAVVVTAMSGSAFGALVPLGVGVFCGAVARGRSSWGRRSSAVSFAQRPIEAA